MSNKETKEFVEIIIKELGMEEVKYHKYGTLLNLFQFTFMSNGYEYSFMISPATDVDEQTWEDSLTPSTTDELINKFVDLLDDSPEMKRGSLVENWHGEENEIIVVGISGYVKYKEQEYNISISPTMEQANKLHRLIPDDEE